MQRMLVIVFTLALILWPCVIAGAAEPAPPALTIGLANQPIGDIALTESEAGSFTVPGQIVLKVPAGVTFSAAPDVTVVDGDLQIDASGVSTDTTPANEGLVLIKVKSSSNEPSVIKISGLKLTLDRTVPEGDILLKIGGSSLVESNIDTLFPNVNWVAKVVVARVVTPAPENTRATTVFKIGDPKYSVNGVEQTADAAPYLKDGRTYLPLRLAAKAAGIAEDNIIWNAGDRSVTLINGGSSVRLVIGSNIMILNNVPVTVDAAPEAVEPGRAMLPLRAVAQALGCNVQWDAATQTVTVN
ncbi:hypothetical protein Pmgp_00009 [Pelotomaculum propionicicum]|uniref:Copper amine oxidase-like N-terminal domain-containing protein n=2 Tax=Pelotomaculum propionicicum TaxID=258475 RepID=A0A4Y7RY07_9FIRM|nr:hypothetical protein Pmgp_00009 [Pelotomaculum propionicicum]